MSEKHTVLNNFRKKKTVKGYEYTKYQTKNPVVRKLIQRFYARIARFLEGLEYRNLLDAGCGDGEALIRLRHLLPETTIGIDIDEEQIRHAKAKMPGFIFDVCDLRSLPYKDNEFDVVLSFEVLEHIPNPEHVLKELVRVSSKYILLSVPHEPLFMLGNLLRGKNISRFGNDTQHINHWRRESFRNFLSHHVDVIDVASAFPWLIALCKKRSSE